MAGDYDTGAQTITGTVTTSIATLGVSLPSATQTLLNINQSMNGSLQTLRTIGAGKVFYLFGVNVSGGAAVGCGVYKDAAMVAYVFSGTSNSGTFTPVVPICSLVAGEALKIQGTNGYPIQVVGIEVNA